MDNIVNPHVNTLSLQATSPDIITISVRISRTKVLHFYSFWKRIVIRCIIFSVILPIPNCIHIELPSFAYTNSEAHIYYNVIPSKDQ